MTSQHVYSKEFFDFHLNGTLQSARIVVPLVMELVSPNSVVDFGCGRGAWLKAFSENGVKTVRGFDGAHINPAELLVDPDCFALSDLSKPLALAEKYDLAVCLEVAEHLEPSASECLITSLISAAPVVLFSAAVPGQGGTHHVNEQWSSYWAELFSKYNFNRLDPIRRHIWHNKQVSWWFRQNIFLYASKEAIRDSTRLQKEFEVTRESDLELICSFVLNQYRYPSIRNAIKQVPKAIRRSAIRRFGK